MMLWYYVAAGGLLVVYEVARSRQAPADWLFLFNAYGLTYYLAVPLVHLSTPGGLQWRALSLYPDASSSPWVFCAIVLAHVCTIAGYEVGRRHPAARGRISLEWINGRAIFLYCGILVLGFAGLSLVAALSSGGIAQSLMMASEVRAGRASRGLVGYAEYAFEIAPLALLIVLGARSSAHFKAGIRWPLIALVFLAVIYLALMAAGRGKLLTPFVLVYLLWLNTAQGLQRRLLPIASAILLLLAVMVIAYGKAAFWELDSMGNGVDYFMERVNARQTRLFGDATILSALSGVMGYFDHHLVSVYLAIDKPNEYEIPRLFLDWPRAIVSYAPGLEQPDFLVTSTASGHGRDLLRQAGMLYIGYVPPGWVAMNYINFMWFGVAVLSMASGFVGGVLSQLLCNHFRSGLAAGSYVVLGWLWMMYGFGADPFMAVPLLLLMFVVFLPVLACLRIRFAS